jgi:hypothetical protein
VLNAAWLAATERREQRGERESRGIRKEKREDEERTRRVQ